MTIPTLSWENRLFALAREPLEQQDVPPPIRADRDTLRQAYAYCGLLTQAHSRTFFLASSLLPVEKRQAVRALYAFCRVTDDLVDRGTRNVLTDLEAWRQKSLSADPPTDDPIALAWGDTLRRYNIPLQYAHQLIDGVAKDIETARYETFDQLAEYAYGVASTVGLMAMYIVGFAGTEAVPYAVKLGVALQLTNILRDVGEDWTNGRLYLPRQDLAAFGLDETDIASGHLDERWQIFLRYQIDRNRRLYREAMPGIALLHPNGRFAIAAAAELYAAILEDIETSKGNVFDRRAFVSRWGKLRRLPAIWWRTQSMPRILHNRSS